MAPELALGGLQRWMQAVIVHPGTADEALAAREAAALVPSGRTESVVRPSASLTAAERVGVYHDMYLGRMREALESDYPGLARFLGPEAWERLVAAYVQAHPSRSYTLNVLGGNLPRFVRTARVPRPAFCHDLARLEWAVTEVFDAPETPPLTEADTAAVATGDWEKARLVPVAALRLVVLDHDAGAHLDALRDGRHRPPPVRRRRNRVVVYRRSYAVYRREQDAAEFALLADLVDGRPVGRAVARALARRGARLRADDAFRLFRDWARWVFSGPSSRSNGNTPRRLARDGVEGRRVVGDHRSTSSIRREEGWISGSKPSGGAGARPRRSSATAWSRARTRASVSPFAAASISAAAARVARG
jgi:hypothetical protein